MPDARLKFNGQEITISGGVTSIGRISDNVVAFPNDSNISRYHAEIERRGEDFWLIDLGSSNGTTVNGKSIKDEIRLDHGNRLAFGGSCIVDFEFVEENLKPQKTTSNSAPSAPAPATAKAVAKEDKAIKADAQAVSGSPKILIIAGAAVGLAIICIVAAGLFYYLKSPAKCTAKATITSPEAGETILKTTDVEVELENGACVSRAIFTLDGSEFANTSDKPFTATLDPKQFADLSDGFEHNLQIVLVDKNGEKIVQPEVVALAFETKEIATPTPTPEIAKNEPSPTPKINQNGGQTSLIDVQEMSKRLVKQFAGNFAYNVSNKQFLGEIQKKIPEYAQAGYSSRAVPFRDQINTAFVREQNLDAPLGFVLAMSRSRFVAAKQGANEGLYQMSNEFVTANAYNGLCGTETLSDASQNCAAKSAALYMKAIVYGVFEGDAIYSAAAFGKSPQDAGAWKASLPADRSDVWNSIKTAPEREQLIRFFAAGIVAENPQKFGLKKDRPLSELYRVAM